MSAPVKPGTPLPWELCDRGDYGDFDGNSRVMLGGDRRIAVFQTDGSAFSEEDALYAHTAIHAYPTQQEAIAELVAGLTTATEIMDDQLCGDFPDTLAELRALIAKHGGGQ